MAFQKVAVVAEVPPGSARSVVLAGKKLALFNVDGRVYAIEDVCPHRGAPLSEGTLTGAEVVCPWHGARFDVRNGAHLCPPAQAGVACFAVQVVGDEVQVDV